MPKIQVKDVQLAVNHLLELSSQAEANRTIAESSLTSLRSLVAGALTDASSDENGHVDADSWNGLSEEDQVARYTRLGRVRDSAAILIDGDGPRDPHSIMYKQYLGNFWVILLVLLALFGTLLTLHGILASWQRATDLPAGPAERDALYMVILMGALGGFLHLMSSLAKFLGNRQLLRSWAVYYLLMPLEGAALAVAVYLLLRVGVLNPSGSGAKDTTANINWIGIYGFSVLAGLFSKQALEMLANVFSTIFAKVQAKDAPSASKPDAHPPSAGATQ